MRLLVLDTRILLDPWLYDECLAHMSAARQQKIARHLQDEDKRRSLAAGMLLDMALADHGLREASAPFLYNPHKKPYLAAGPCFSISHSGSFAVCACAECEVGVDVERCRRAGETLIKRVCTPQEAKRILAMDEAVRNREFVRLWAVKESVLKWLGTGISVDPRELSVRFDVAVGESPIVEHALTEADLTIREYALEDYGFALCCEREAVFPEPEFVCADQLRLRP